MKYLKSNILLSILSFFIVCSAFGKEYYEKMIIQQSNSRSIDYNLLLAIVDTESNFRPKVKSFRGALGLSQITLPVAKDRLGYSHKDRSRDAELRKKLLNPKENIEIALMHLAWIDKHLSGSFQGNDRLRMVAAVYNAGHRSFINRHKRLPNIGEGLKRRKPLEKWKKRERDGYIQKVLKAYSRFENKYGPSPYSILEKPAEFSMR